MDILYTRIEVHYYSGVPNFGAFDSVVYEGVFCDPSNQKGRIKSRISIYVVSGNHFKIVPSLVKRMKEEYKKY